ncbi:hypothetical protein PsYK624_013440 [Phanerochaete sordida]|uniref:F-box domain-containing protein n=1 Tax=Phanerochaete sordida TaxID=48140 RepID=A0A9P3FZM9_9APHY|nr:hypothetical protein PsYK624_013440 [Phanerochaete sordida]
MTPLSLDVVACILSFLAGDKSTLFFATLVSREWRRLAQIILFREINICVVQTVVLERFVNLVKARPELGIAIRDLQLSSTPARPSTHGAILTPVSSIRLEFCMLSQLLLSLPKLEFLSLRGLCCTWCSRTRLHDHTCIHDSSHPSLTGLVLDSLVALDVRAEPMRLLDVMPNVSYLFAAAQTASGWDPTNHPSARPRQRPLEYLSIAFPDKPDHLRDFTRRLPRNRQERCMHLFGLNAHFRSQAVRMLTRSQGTLERLALTFRLETTVGDPLDWEPFPFHKCARLRIIMLRFNLSFAQQTEMVRQTQVLRVLIAALPPTVTDIHLVLHLRDSLFVDQLLCLRSVQWRTLDYRLRVALPDTTLYVKVVHRAVGCRGEEVMNTWWTPEREVA